jgi:hypothetical protein
MKRICGSTENFDIFLVVFDKYQILNIKEHNCIFHSDYYKYKKDQILR